MLRFSRFLPFNVSRTLAASIRAALTAAASATRTSAIAELARLAVKAKSESGRIAAIRELLDRGYGRPRQAVEVSAPAGDPLQELLHQFLASRR